MAVSLPGGHAIHPNRRLDVYVGNMIANRGCEVRDHKEDYFLLECGCPKKHIQTVQMRADDLEDYASRRIHEIEEAFTCC